MPTTAEILALAERLEEESLTKMGRAFRSCTNPDCALSANLADEAAAMLRQWALGEYICRCGQRVDSVLSKQEVDF